LACHVVAWRVIEGVRVHSAQAILFSEDDYSAAAATQRQQQLLSDSNGFGGPGAKAGSLAGAPIAAAPFPQQRQQSKGASGLQSESLQHSARDSSMPVGDSVNELPPSAGTLALCLFGTSQAGLMGL
jgi:hypothetical protein